MRLIEAHVYRRGYAYRYGGDEYSVLLDNVTEEEALASMDSLRRGLGSLTYEGITKRTTVSIGVFVVRPECHLTGSEILDAAARAKNYAKAQGRDCVAYYGEAGFHEGHIQVAPQSLL
jgi:diguanylate cyclase (GGDEF)-like protein